MQRATGGRHQPATFDNQMTRLANLTCCSYEQTIEKLRRYYAMSDAALKEAIIAEITVNIYLSN